MAEDWVRRISHPGGRGNDAWPETHRGGMALTQKRSRLRAVLSGPRIVRFGTVAASCTLLQLLFLAVAVRLGMNKILANGLGFVLAAQVNFVLSARWTWRDRPLRPAGRGQLTRWALFNGTALSALAANELVFSLLTWSGMPFLAASLCGIVCGAALAFSLNHTVTFREHGDRKSTRLNSS